ncbi:HAD hydrolase-like protein [Kaistia terrae]|uniref:HAD hydrolase-like protein n=1 Tax=Kaistia terrae TaxID=537017 RepID=A0ABW0Q0W1_9HYPH|nr:HAD hydrolase-like protein [Kaistia terrae]MCX5579060.1 HAD hydrolase-like protein [Kaistia terrae]
MTAAKLTALVDLDGTLTDPYPGISASILYALEKLERPAADELALRAAIGPPLEGSFAMMLDGDPILAKQALGHYRDRFGTVGLYENAVFDGIPEALGALRDSGVQMFLASSKPRVFCEKILDHFDLTQFFVRVHGSELDGRYADKSELVAHILSVETIDPAHCVMIGDRRYDIEGARSNGIKVAAVGWGYGTVEEFDTFPPDAIVPHVVDLAPAVLKLLG